MATLEKPKHKKSKKSKVQQERSASLQEVDTENDNDDIEKTFKLSVEVQETTSTKYLQQFENLAVKTEEIVSYDCSIAGGSTNEQTKLEYGIENISLHDELAAIGAAEPTAPAGTENDEPTTPAGAESVEPITHTDTAIYQSSSPLLNEATAPPIETKATHSLHIATVTTPTAIQYPNLKPLQQQQIERSAPIVYQQQSRLKTPSFSLAKSDMKPFTAEQLKQFYNCTELEQVKQFELEYLTNSLLQSYVHDPLHQALMEYYDLQSKLKMNLHDMERMRKECAETQQRIWVKEEVKKSFNGTCVDGSSLEATVKYDIMKVDQTHLMEATAALKNLYNLMCSIYVSNRFIAGAVKVKIDRMINEYTSLQSIAKHSKQVTLQATLDKTTLNVVARLRHAISIIFTFKRKLSPNKAFEQHVNTWLRQLVAVHLQLATKEDHWFLLLNILRCPSGISTWATELVQIPCSTLNENVAAEKGAATPPVQLTGPELNHCVAVLQILLLPIKKRNDYLREFTQDVIDPVQDERWILVDSDGEDSHTPSGDCIGLKESDLIALLNQIPFEQLFCAALGIEKFLGDYIIEADNISSHQMLCIVAFFTKLLDIFGEGMLTYNTERYKQLAKRLGRLVRHILQYAADFHELFIHNNHAKEPSTCERIVVELKALLLKACSYIHRTRNLATWQYFSSLPYQTLDADTIWQIFYYLNVGFPDRFANEPQDYMSLLNADDFWIKFNVAHADSSPEDLYYLLQAFFEMANGCDKLKDWDLIKEICLHIFNIGFVNESTRDFCYKTSRDMLVNLTLAYENLMSCLLMQLKVRFKQIDNVIFLFKTLPLENWKPDMDSFEILSNWLLNFDFKTQENMLARLIISHLNWSFDCDGRLFLPHNIHVRMACLLAEALTKHAAEAIGKSSLADVLRYASSLVDFNQNTKEHFTNWCWSMVSILRLHLMDQGVESIKRTLQNPTEPLMFIPELNRIDMIYEGVTEQRSISIFVGILVSLHGHSIPLICQQGFELMKLLLNDYRHAAVIRCLELIVPLFLETPETLANNVNFQFILNNLLNADKTYLKMAKDMVFANSLGPVMELLDNMIHHQITSYSAYGLASPLNLINIWLNCFTSFPNWQTTNIVYLMDQVLRIAYQFPDCRSQAVEYLRNYYKDCEDWKGNNKLSALKTFFGSNQSRIPVLTPRHSWLSLVLLEIEFNTQDQHFWPEFLRQLAASDTGTSLETVLKKTTNIVKTQTFPGNMLVIYKYANFIANMDIRHPLFPIINQRFFELYLCRLPMHYDEQSYQHIYAVANKFYEYNVPLMKKLKTNLLGSASYHENEALNCAADDGLSYFHRNCAKMMKTYTLWLEDTAINKFTKDELNYPSQYNSEKLREILNGNTEHWTEFIYLPAIRQLQRYQAEQWAAKCYRLKKTMHLRTPVQAKAKSTPCERIKSHLASYDKCLEPPLYQESPLEIPKEITKSTMRDLKQLLVQLNRTANEVHEKSSELNCLNRHYLDMIVELYEMKIYKEIQTKSCDSLLFNSKCKGPAKIEVTLERIEKNPTIDDKIQDYHQRNAKLLQNIVDIDVDEFAISVEKLSGIVKLLVQMQQFQTSSPNEMYSKTGIELFFAIVEHMSETSMLFAPTNDLFSHLLNELGVFIQENQEHQAPVVLSLALKRPELIKTLAAVFVPYRTPPECFLKCYKSLIESYLKRCDTKVLFVLFSKFDVVMWLESFHPKLYDINQLLQLILQGLVSWSQPDSSLLQDQFRRHLVHTFNYDFPQHYGEVLQSVLDRVSDEKLMPVVLLDLLNSLLISFSCDTISLETTQEHIQQIAIDFGKRQQLFNLKAATDTIMLFARHFQKERLHHGLHGLYPKHKEYCQPLAAWFSCIAHALVCCAICTYQELLADQISDIVFASIVEMYSPWLVTYTEQTMQMQATSNWIRQLTENGKMLYPWSEQHAGTCRIMVKTFINTLKFVLDYLPASHKILDHTIGWYIHHFSIPNLEKHVFAPVHEGISGLPWEQFKPQANYIELLYESVQKFVPECHAMLGHIFTRINWNSWFAEQFPTIPINSQSHVCSRLFVVFIKIAFEPNIHINITTSKILEDAINYPWYMVDYVELEKLMQWFVTQVEPSIVLKMPVETNYADRAVLDLIRLACAMMPERSTAQPVTNATAKRILYTRSMVRLLRACAGKNQRLLVTKAGQSAFKSAFLDLLNTMNNAIYAMLTIQASEAAPMTSLELQKRESLNLMIEILNPMQTQSEETSNLLIGALVQWHGSCDAGNLLMLMTLNALGHMKHFIAGSYWLLETSIGNYFRQSPKSNEWHNPTWLGLMEAVSMSLDKLELMPIMSGTNFFTLHVFVIKKMEQIQNLGDRITFLQDLSQLVEALKTTPFTEPRLALVWGVIISRGCLILSQSEHAKKPLLMLARHLQAASAQAESWGDSLLGAVGLKKDAVTNKRKVLTRCLACAIFAMFPDTSAHTPQPSAEYNSALRELSYLVANKKFQDVKNLITKAVTILNADQLPALRDIPHLISRIIHIFYTENYLTTIPEVWDFDYRLG